MKQIKNLQQQLIQKRKKNFIDNKLIYITLLNPNLKELNIKNRSTTISTTFFNKRFSIYNGNIYKSFDIDEKYQNHKFGELFMTRKILKHSKK